MQFGQVTTWTVGVLGKAGDVSFPWATGEMQKTMRATGECSLLFSCAAVRVSHFSNVGHQFKPQKRCEGTLYAIL